MVLVEIFWLGLLWWLLCCNSQEEQPPGSFNGASRSDIRDAMRNKKEEI